MKDIRKGIFTVLVGTGILCFSVPAEAISVGTGNDVGTTPAETVESGPASNVWLDVIQVPTQARISVTVPLSYGFAVIGSVEDTAVNPVSVENGNLLLPNIRVVVKTPSGVASNAVYEIQTVSESSIPIRNYSTDVRDENADEEIPPREGLPVAVQPYMIALPVDDNLIPIPIHHWQPSLTDPTWKAPETADEAKVNFKKFQMVLDGLAFSEPEQKSISTILSNGTVTNKVWNVIWLENKSTIALDAPPSVPDYGYTSAGTARIPSEKHISVQVRVGGIQNQYTQVEESLKVGAIYWEVIPGALPIIPGTGS